MKTFKDDQGGGPRGFYGGSKDNLNGEGPRNEGTTVLHLRKTTSSIQSLVPLPLLGRVAFCKCHICTHSLPADDSILLSSCLVVGFGWDY